MDPGLRDGHLRRVLALSGGGVRGIVEVAFLEAVEAEYRRRFGAHVQLRDVFDLVGGTSTGALIAASVAVGLPMSEVRDFYLHRAKSYFARRRFWKFIVPVYHAAELENEIRSIVGGIKMDDPSLGTLLAVVMKRLDTGSPWIVSNLPDAPYWNDPPDGSYQGNRHFVLARLLSASTAAPTFFQQQAISIGPTETGVFVDGSASPFNDPTLALLMLARLKAYGLNWPTGPDRLFFLSIGTGRFRHRTGAAKLAGSGPLFVAYNALRGLISDSDTLTVTLMQALGRSRHPVWLNTEVGDLSTGGLLDSPIAEYLKLDLPLDGGLLAEDNDFAQLCAPHLRRMDDYRNIEVLYGLARSYCAKRYDLTKLLP